MQICNLHKLANLLQTQHLDKISATFDNLRDWGRPWNCISLYRTRQIYPEKSLTCILCMKKWDSLFFCWDSYYLIEFLFCDLTGITNETTYLVLWILSLYVPMSIILSSRCPDFNFRYINYLLLLKVELSVRLLRKEWIW